MPPSRPNYSSLPSQLWCRGWCARSLADRTQHNITNQNHTVLPCTLLRLKHRHSTYLILVGGFLRAVPDSFSPGEPSSLPPSDPPESPAHLAPGTWHLSTLYATYCRKWCTPALPCPVSPRLASPLSRCSPHLITQYAIRYKVSIINPQPVLCPRPNNIAPLLRPVLAPTQTQPTARPHPFEPSLGRRIPSNPFPPCRGYRLPTSLTPWPPNPACDQTLPSVVKLLRSSLTV